MWGWLKFLRPTIIDGFVLTMPQLSRGHRWLVLSASGFTSQHLVVSQKTEPSFSGTKCGVLGQSQLKMWPVDMARWDWGNSAVQQYIAFRKVRSKTDILLR